MFILGYFIEAAARVLDLVLLIYLLIIIARTVVSWVNPDPYNPIVRFLYNATEPILYRIRKKFPITFGGIDFTPAIVILTIMFVRVFVVNSLHEMSRRMLTG